MSAQDRRRSPARPWSPAIVIDRQAGARWGASCGPGRGYPYRQREADPYRARREGATA